LPDAEGLECWCGQEGGRQDVERPVALRVEDEEVDVGVRMRAGGDERVPV